MELGLPRHHVATEMTRCPPVSYYREVQSEAGHPGAGRGPTRLPTFQDKVNSEGQEICSLSKALPQQVALTIRQRFLPLCLPAAMSRGNL